MRKLNYLFQEWFFDVIIGFLRSPRWKTPVMSFLDEKCIAFDGEDENKLEFTTIHNVSFFLYHNTFEGIQEIGLEFIRGTDGRLGCHRSVVRQRLLKSKWKSCPPKNCRPNLSSRQLHRIQKTDGQT